MAKKFATFDSSGALLLRFDSARNDVPNEAIEIEGSLWVRMVVETDGIWIMATDGSITKEPLPPPTEQELATHVFALRDQLLETTVLRIAPLQDAVDIDDATEQEISLLRNWKQYRIALNRIQDQPGFPSSIDWPQTPV